MPVWLFCQFIGIVAMGVWGVATVLNHIDRKFDNTVTIPQFQGWAAQLQDENPTLHVRIPGVRIDQDVTAKRTTTQQNGL